VSRILIVEDEAEMAGLLSKALSEEGFVCDTASNGLIGLSKSDGFDLLLVDVMMPVMNGFALVEKLRSKGERMPVIFLTAKDTTKDIVRGLEGGGDDYLVKPFVLEELIARVKAALRRGREASHHLGWHDIRLDCARRIALRDNVELFLSPTEFALLEMFMRRPGAVLPKSLILEEVWHADGFRDENIVELYVNYLRKKTEIGGRGRVIHTVRGRGYVLGSNELEP
jgi:two-component system copper resistance phosphate regulon response regulator CusR